MNFFGKILAMIIISSSAIGAEKILIGKYKSRALFSSAIDVSKKSPAIILIPGSGEFDPEELMPKSYPLSGSDG